MDNELVKVVRIGRRETTPADDYMDEDSTNEFSEQFLSEVRFSSLVFYPKMNEIIIPSEVWDPKVHHYFPDSFRSVCKELLLCSQSDYYQAPPRQIPPEDRVNLAAMLPKVIWMEIMSFTHRSCKFALLRGNPRSKSLAHVLAYMLLCHQGSSLHRVKRPIFATGFWRNRPKQPRPTRRVSRQNSVASMPSVNVMSIVLWLVAGRLDSGRSYDSETPTRAMTPPLWTLMTRPPSS